MAVPPTPTDAPSRVLGPTLASQTDTTLADATLAAAEQVVEVMEERVRVEKRLVETDHARIHISVEEHDEPVEALLMRQDLVIERKPLGTRIEAVPPVRRDGDTVVVPVVEEVLVVEKRLVLKEELHIRIDVTKQKETQTVRLRREHVDIERDAAGAVPDPTRSAS